jgi:hypothetical protein
MCTFHSLLIVIRPNSVQSSRKGPQMVVAATLPIFFAGSY